MQTINENISVDSQLEKVNEVIKSSLNSDVPLINQIGKYIIESGGKKTRPQCLINLAGLAGSVKAVHFQLAAIIELIHTATLLHDDVVDESEKRRNTPTANIKFGNAASILVGDFLYSRSFQMMVDINNIEIMDVLAFTTNKIAEGEVMQLISKNNTDLTEEEYMNIIQSKTGVLFEACGKLAAVSNPVDPYQEKALSQIGKLYGKIYQLVDDILDYSGDAKAIGKNLGDDLKDGKMTLPLLAAYRASNIHDKELIKSAIVQGDVSQLTRVINIIEKTKSISYSKNIVLGLMKDLDEKLDLFDNDDYKHRIRNFFADSINRHF